LRGPRGYPRCRRLRWPPLVTSSGSTTRSLPSSATARFTCGLS
jgi:hypothetical protein